jgi:hypothetical protein
MAQHFLLSPGAKTLTLAQAMRMSNEEAETMFARIRWPETNGEPACPNCGGRALYDVGHPGGAPRWRCKACNKGFSVTSGTLFAWHKLPVQSYLAAIAIFANEVKAKAPWRCPAILARHTKPLGSWRTKSARRWRPR